MEIIQSYLGVGISGNKEEFTNETILRLIGALKVEIGKNDYKMVEGSRIYDIKDDTDVYPQSKTIGEIETKWDRFAKEKGIKKRKSGRRSYNEETKEWEFKYGSKSIKNQKLASGIVEGKKTVSQLKRDKQKRIEKNRRQQQKNKDRAMSSK
ncbi:RRS1 [Enterospora canceri]|uniref:Ribosome biogenesis regulatory protein n=1 Tax=Enterospora canceri TaxID=1081671 RepID=A0A1Y1S6S7_9MICR|nr:RRS1 [Enterospora canceri]